MHVNKVRIMNKCVPARRGEDELTHFRNEAKEGLILKTSKLRTPQARGGRLPGLPGGRRIRNTRANRAAVSFQFALRRITG